MTAHGLRGKGVLDGVDFSIGEGEVFALPGPNGAGRGGTGAWSTVSCMISSFRFGGGIEI
jgi:Fe-S cluster assembly ATPase SufC